MTDYNYKLVYNGNFRWTDYRSANPTFTFGLDVRLDIVTFDNNNSVVCHIHNLSTHNLMDCDKHVKTTLSAFVGVGRLTHEIFGQMTIKNLHTHNEAADNWYSSLYIGYHPKARLAFIATPHTYDGQNNASFGADVIWHQIPLIDTAQLPLILAIPLTQISVR